MAGNDRDDRDKIIVPSENEINIDQKVAILQHKWILSEKSGFDVGWDYAYKDFYINHSHKWRVKKMQEDFKRQKEEILKHKWYLSEQKGFDVGMEFAALDWIKSGYAEQWRDRKGVYKDKRDL